MLEPSAELLKIKKFGLDELYPEGYIIKSMNYELKSTGQYDKWFRKLKDASAKIKILARLSRIENGNFGDHKQIDTTLYELRFLFGPGYRVYYTIHGTTVVLLLAGGDKSTQQKDIRAAKNMLKEMEE